MKLNLKKKELVNLSHDNKVLPAELTPEVGGGAHTCGCDCAPQTQQNCQTPTSGPACRVSLEPGETCGRGQGRPGRRCVDIF